ncbi:MAG: S8 family serine peptidase, partial [Caldilineaceae bacterium]|nr:S8 family serine peptidase [Caldilineaceae bacterium]
GNDGSRCSTVRNPISMHDATFSVGAHNEAGTIAGFSSRGPVTADGSGRLKPDITAPGVGVRSAWLNGGYNTIQGTSMASPHVSGAVALLWSAVPELIGNIDLTEQILIKSATPVPANNCGEGNIEVVPNNTYGYGRLDILAAVELAQTPVSLTVQLVTDQGVALGEQAVTLTDQLTGYSYQSTTAFNGITRIGPLYPGNYLVSVDGLGTTQAITLSSELQQQAQITVTAAVSKTYLPFIMK